ncbi:hypothetical protein FGG08_004921 [Glutinoglossum americanum]|uniref:O-acyltransferase n=1 Tax=Glutinoglossum americanum TaxID=1670608 RepID=A0A9P8L289_9PEZI|nr:hypothetical protein FGG08_004921 [Glutinoglossum americanum]
MTHSMERHPSLSANDSALEDAYYLVGQLALDGSIRSLKPDPPLDMGDTSNLRGNGAAISGNVPSTDSGNNSVTESLDATSDEDYDNLKMDSSSIVTGGRGGRFLGREEQVRDGKHHEGVKGWPVDSMSEARVERRQSFSVKLEKTDETGRYLLTSDDPELRELLAAITDHASGGGKKRAKFGDLIFTRRFTAFDRYNPTSTASPFHGFFTLFWLSVFVFILKIVGDNWRTYGSVFGRNEMIHMMFSREVAVLGVTDGIMCAGTVMGLLLQKAVSRGWIQWSKAGWVIQSVWQAFYLGAVIGWTIYRDWQWTHTVFIVLHCMVMLMKQHSYAFYNGYLSDIFLRREMLLKKSRQFREPDTPGAYTHTATTESFSVADLADINSLARRRLSSSRKIPLDLRQDKAELSKVASAINSGVPLNREQISSFAKIVDWEIEALTIELNGKCSISENHYPKNLTLKNWAEYIVLPTLVYELEYPRQEQINWSYVAEKTAATFGIVGVMIVVSQAYIYPVVMRTVEMRDQGWTLRQRLEEFPRIYNDLLFPFGMEYLLAFYVIWECILNVLAELTRFADRGFYADWWNSTSWDDAAPFGNVQPEVSEGKGYFRQCEWSKCLS